MKLDVTTLRRVSPLLDEALDLEGSQREAWLARLEHENPDLAPILRDMLKTQASAETNDLFENGPEFTAPRQAAQSGDFKPGDSVGPYRLNREIGAGGMGEVWLAERSDGVLKRSVALKLPMISLRRSVLVQRFERERDILASLTHPNIARLYDAGLTESGQPYLALEYVEGAPITLYADRHKLDARARIRLLLQVMQAVQFAHANLVIHRDLKPANVLVTAEGKALLLDFGIAKLLEEDVSQANETELTRLGGRALTLSYAAPEQVTGLPISIATDVWALGVVLHELLCGQRPFGTGDRTTLEHEVLHADPVRPSHRKAGTITKLPGGLARELDTIVLKALKKAPAERYATVSAFAEDLNRWLNGEPVQAQPDSNWYRVRKFVGRHQVVVATVSLATAAVVGIAAVAVVLGMQAREESARAQASRDFLIDLFRQTDPELARGQDVTAKQLLVQGRKMVVDTMASQPLLQAELLRGIGNALSSMEDDEKADECFAQVVKLYTQVNRPRDAAIALLDQAHLAIAAGDSTRSADFVLRAEKLYPHHAADDEFMARYLVSQGGVAATTGDYPKAREWLAAALPVTARTFSPSDARAVYGIRVLAEMEALMGDFQPAIERLNRLMATLSTDKEARPVDILGIVDDLAQFEFQTGQFRVAMESFESANERCEKIHDPKGGECAYTQVGRSGVLLIMGHYQKAMESTPVLLAHATSAQHSLENTAALFRVHRILALNGVLHRHPEVSARVKAFGDSNTDLKQNGKFKVEALLVQAQFLLQGQQPHEAQKLLDRAEIQFEALHLKDRRLLGQVRLYQGLSAQMLHQDTTALRLLQAATDEHAAILGAAHPLTLLVSVHQARALWGNQQRDAALALLERTISPLQAAMGVDAPNFVRIKALREEIVRSTAPSDRRARQADIFM